ncbi:MAG: ATP-dependent carboxylate-amine ligase [Parcubacteria group bacterium]|nr:ATP-dependent carboxylate-amine ligase [Parcubacteria group bacterium]|tara:strand:+ start:56523 stop:57587 length:1065 start_codon:yes stop_codon:yes gene_type:complete
MKQATVLITGIGGPGAPGTIKSLKLIKERKIKIVGIDMDKNAVGFSMVDKSYIVPPAQDKNFIQTLLKISKKEKVDVILPLSASGINELAQSKKKFEDHGIKISISNPGALKNANNKYSLLDHCKRNNIPAPDFYLAKNYKEFEKAVFALGYPKKGVCFKPPISKGARGFRILTKKPNHLASLIDSKPNNALISFKEAQSILKIAKPFPELIVMEYLPGKEYSVDTLADEGEVLLVVPRSRDKTKMGISVVGTTVKDKEIIKYSKKIIEALKLNGNIGFQFKKDKNGVPKIIESNPRLQGTTVLCTAAGVNLVYLAVKLALGEKIVKPKIKWGTKMIRYWQEIYYDKSGHSFTL